MPRCRNRKCIIFCLMNMLQMRKKEENPPATLCSTCLSPVGKGLLLKCNQFTFRENIKSLAAKDPQVAEQIAYNIISTKESSPHRTTRLSRETGGKPIPITPGKNSKTNIIPYVMKIYF